MDAGGWIRFFGECWLFAAGSKGNGVYNTTDRSNTLTGIQKGCSQLAAGEITMFHAALFMAIVVAVAAPASARSAQAVVDEMLATDRAFAARAASIDTATALSAMFDERVVMPLPNASFARSRGEAVVALRGNPFNLASRAEWTPVRGGVSADGQHGFTFGFMTLSGNDGEVRLAKYLSYWVKRPEGWRVAAYKRAARPKGEVTTALLAPALPLRLVAPIRDALVLRKHRESLERAERAFSDAAQQIGVREAFQRNGSADAMNMGSGPGFAIGLEAIGAEGRAPPATGPKSPTAWAADDLLVASSGDLGVTWGRSLANTGAPEGTPPVQIFMTFWRRASPDTPWRYVAE